MGAMGSKGGSKDKGGGNQSFATGFMSGMANMGGMMMNTGSMPQGSTGAQFMGAMFPQMTQQMQMGNIFESLNQQYNRPTPDTQGPMAPVGGVSMRNRFMGMMRSQEE